MIAGDREESHQLSGLKNSMPQVVIKPQNKKKIIWQWEREKNHSAFAASRVLSAAELSLMKNWPGLEEAEQEMRRKWWNCGKNY